MHRRAPKSLATCSVLGLAVLWSVAGSVAADEPPKRPTIPIDPSVTQHSVDRAEAARRERESEDARERRARSRTAHRGLGRDEAIALARSKHPGLASRRLGMALGLEGDQRVVRFLSAGSALVDMGPHDAIAASTAPMAVKDDDGPWRPVDLDLVAVAGGFGVSRSAVEARVPTRAGQVAAVGRGGVGVVPLRGASDSAGELVDGRVFWPSAETDTDVLALPVPEGLEVAYFLRSPDAAEDLALGLSLPAGAVAGRGIDPLEGVRVTKDGETLAQITAPVAVDASGQSLPVKYAVRDGDLVMHVDHRGEDVEYPIAVDPIVNGVSSIELEQEWQSFGHGFDGWSTNVVHQDSRAQPWRFSAGDVGAGRGLNIWRDAGYYFPWERADWVRTAPGNSFIAAVNVRSIQWWLSKSCIWIGISRYSGGTYPWLNHYEDCRGESWTVNNGYFYGVGPLYTPLPGQADTHYLVLANHESTYPEGNRGFHMAHWGNAEIFYSDVNDPTTTTPVANSSWVNPDRVGGTVQGSASDAGVGLAKAGLDASWNNADYDFGGTNNCTGNWNSICPGTDTETRAMTAVPDGLHTISTRAEDLLGKVSVSATTTLRVDRGNPKATLSGPSINTTDPHIAVGAGRHAVTVTGTDPPRTGVVNASGARSTTLAIGAAPPSREARYTTASGCSANCTVTGAYTFDAGPPPSPFGLDSFTDVPGKTLQTHTAESGGPWVRHASSSLDAVITVTGRVRRNGSGNGLLSLTGTHPNADYDVSADVVVPQPTEQKQGDVGIVGRLNTTTGEGYVAAYSQAAQQWQLHRRGTDGLLQQIGWASASITAGVVYRLVLRLRGSSLSVFVNGSLVIAATDNTLAGAGRAGVYFYGPQGGAAQPSDTATPQLDTFTASGAGRTEGPHDFTLSTTDGAGNSATNTYRVVVDRTAPSQDPASGSMAELRAIDESPENELLVTGRDAGVWPNIAGMGRFELLVDGAVHDVATAPLPAQAHTATLHGDGSATRGLSEGRHQAQVKVYDDAIRHPQGTGNQGPAPQSFSFVVDRGIPDRIDQSGALYNLRGTTLTAGAYGYRAVGFDGVRNPPSAPDPTLERAGVTRMEILVDGDLEHDADAACPAGSCSLAIDWTFDTTRYPGGNHEIAVVAIDSVGHEKRESFTVTTPCCSGAETLWGLAPMTDDIHYGDVDGDEVTDLVRRNKLTGGVSVSTSSGQSFNTSSSWGQMPISHGVQLGDANADGYDDLIGHNTVNGEVRIGLSNGSSFASPTAWGTWPLNGTFSARDVDVDGRADLVGRHPTTDKLIVSRSSGSAYPAPVDYTTGPVTGALAFEDVDGDEAADAIIRDPNTGSVQVALSDVSNFEPAAGWGTLETGRTWQFGDIDADGLADAVGTNSDSTEVVVSSSTGGAFETQRAFGSFRNDVEVHVEELNGDGKLDFVGRHPATGEMRVSLNTGGIRLEGEEPEWVPDPDLTYDDEDGTTVSTRSDVGTRSHTPPRKVRLMWEDDARLIDRANLFPQNPDPNANIDPFLYDPNNPRSGGPAADAKLRGILRRFRQAGGELVRVLVIWGRTERANPASEAERYYFDRLDRAVDLIQGEGLEVYMTITGVAETWDCGRYLRPGETGPMDPENPNDPNFEFVGFTCASPDIPSGVFPAPNYSAQNDPGVARLEHWERFVDGVVDHFYPRGVTKYGIYNEPNHKRRTANRGTFLRGTDADEDAGIIPARTYRDIFIRGFRAARSGRNDVQVMIGDLSSAPRRGVLPTSPRQTNPNARLFSPMEFLVEVMRPPRAGVAPDPPGFSGPIQATALALHPYQHYFHPIDSRGSRKASGMGRLSGRPSGEGLQQVAQRGLVKRTIELLHRETSVINDNWFRKPRAADVVPDLRLTEFGYLNVSLGNTPPPSSPPNTAAERRANNRRIRQSNMYWRNEVDKAAIWTAALNKAQSSHAAWITMYQAVERATRSNEVDALTEQPRRPDVDYQDYGLFGLTDTPNATGGYDHPITGTRGYGKDPRRQNHTDPGQPNQREAYCAIWRWVRRQVRRNGIPYPSLSSNACGTR